MDDIKPAKHMYAIYKQLISEQKTVDEIKDVVTKHPDFKAYIVRHWYVLSHMVSYGYFHVKALEWFMSYAKNHPSESLKKEFYNDSKHKDRWSPEELEVLGKAHVSASYMAKYAELQFREQYKHKPQSEYQQFYADTYKEWFGEYAKVEKDLLDNIKAVKQEMQQAKADRIQSLLKWGKAAKDIDLNDDTIQSEWQVKELASLTN